MTSPSLSDVDGGWAWIVLGASYFNQLVCAGLAFVAGMFQVIFLEEFNGSVAFTSWVTGLFSALLQLAGPLASSLSNLCTCRMSVMLGGGLLSVGFFISGMMDSLQGLMVSFGAVAGLGMGMTYIPSIVVINYFFDKKRPLVNGIASSAGGLGILIAPQISQLLFENFSWRESLFILAGISAHICIAGALMFPVHEKPTAKNLMCFRKDEVKEYDDDYLKTFLNGENEFIVGGKNDEIDIEREIEMNEVAVHNGYVKTSGDERNIQENGDDRVSRSNSDVISFGKQYGFKENEFISKNEQILTEEREYENRADSDDSNGVKVNKKRINSMSSTSGENFDDLPLLYSTPSNTVHSDSCRELCADDDNPSLLQKKQSKDVHETDSKSFKSNRTVEHQRKDVENHESANSIPSHCLQRSASQTTENGNIIPDKTSDEKEMNRKNDNDFILRQEVRPSVKEMVEQPEMDAPMLQSSLHLTHKHPSFYKNGSFLVLCLALFVNSAGAGSFLIHVPSFLLSRDLTGREVTNILSINGVAILFGRSLVGALVNSQPGNEELFLIMLQLVGGILMSLYPIIGTSYASCMGMMFGIAAYAGTFYSLLPTVTIQYDRGHHQELRLQHVWGRCAVYTWRIDQHGVTWNIKAHQNNTERTRQVLAHQHARHTHTQRLFHLTSPRSKMST